MNRVSALRVSLLISMGIVPAACGGTTLGHDPEGGGSGGSDTGGTSGRGGNTARAGRASGGGSVATGGTGTTTTGGTGVTTGGTGVTSGGFASGGTHNGKCYGIPGGPSYCNCTSPQINEATGLVTCDEGYVHRPTAKLCGVVLDEADQSAGGAASDIALPPNRANGSVPCAENPSVCDQFQYGYCNSDFSGGEAPLRTCLSGCVTDADCGAGAICLCDTPASPTGGSCRPASCQTDQDCGGTSMCANYQQICGRGGFSCLTYEDECVTNADCPPGGTCGPDPFGGDEKTSRRTCITGVACGRPFLVHEQARVAPLAHGSSWRETKHLTPQLQHLTQAERASLAAHWSSMGQLEHASIAAFARFSLQLLALGAPPELVEACTQALADETAHTRLCFELASAYAGRAIGPGPLDVGGSLEASSLVDVVDLVLAEGCFGETGAALDAFEAAEGAADPVIAAAYSRIATDEQRHAELAFRFMRWALERGGNAVAERIAAAIAAPPSTSAATCDVTLPCLRALLQSYGVASAPAQTTAVAC